MLKKNLVLTAGPIDPASYSTASLPEPVNATTYLGSVIDNLDRHIQCLAETTNSTIALGHHEVF